LREVLGDPLLVRDGRSLVLTERARALVPAVQAALSAVQTVFEAPPTFDPLAARGEVRLAFGDDTQAAFAGPLIRAFDRVAPGLDLRFHPLGFQTVREGRRGTIDLAFSPDLSALPPSAGRVDLGDFVVRRLYDRRFVTLWSPDRPGPPPTTLARFAEARHVLVSQDGSARGFVDDLLDAVGVVRRIGVTVPSLATAVHLVATTDLVGTLPSELATIVAHPVVQAEPPVAIPPVPMLLVWHPRLGADPRHRFVREQVARTILEAQSAADIPTRPVLPAQ
ncbi:MAG: LysR substrate-binding domain-containing protein, partial [Myxococcota bacterium]